MKPKTQWKKVPARCSCCRQCHIYLEGPMKGCCDFGGPFKGYYDEVSGKTITLSDIEKPE